MEIFVAYDKRTKKRLLVDNSPVNLRKGLKLKGFKGDFYIESFEEDEAREQGALDKVIRARL